jgi:glycine betaine transporter
MFELNTLLVPVDFSSVSENALRRGMELVHGDDAALILLHVVDPTLADLPVALELGERDALVHAMRARAQRELDALRARDAGHVEIQTIVCEGVPFIEILRKAEDFDVDAILMGKLAHRDRLEKLLFGTTVERVIRGTKRAVIVIPVEN